METGKRIEPMGKAGRLRSMLFLLASSLFVLVGCNKPVPRVVNLYDLSGYNLMQCTSITRSQMGQSQGVLKCVAPDGEKYQGEWMSMTMGQAADATTDRYMSSMPSILGNALVSRWSWAVSFGVDLESVTGRYGIFILYGSKGTVIDGIFLFRDRGAGLLGAAVDTRGHRYKVMG